MAENFNLVQSMSVSKLKNGNLHSQCYHLSTFEEASAWVSTDTRELRIIGAGLEIYRSLHEKTGYSEFPQLVGMEAYVHSGRKIKDKIGPDHPMAQNLLVECVKGIIQVESFIYAERGYPDLSSYVDYWCALNDNTCYTFTHRKDGPSLWSVNPRNYNLFNRSRVIHGHKNNHKKMLYGTFIDTYHEINIHLTLDPGNVVLDVSADFIRMPGEICKNSAIRLQDLVGHNLTEMNKQQIRLLIGGSEGCSHLLEIVNDAIRSMNYSNK